MEHSSHRPTGHDASENELFRQLKAGLEDESLPLTEAALEQEKHNEARAQLHEQLHKMMRGEGGISEHCAHQKLDRHLRQSARHFGKYAEASYASLQEFPEIEASTVTEAVIDTYLDDETELQQILLSYEPEGDFMVSEDRQKLVDVALSNPGHLAGYFEMQYFRSTKENIAILLQTAPQNIHEAEAQIAALNQALELPASNAPCYEKAAYKIKSAARVAKSALESAIEKRKFRQAARAVKK